MYIIDDTKRKWKLIGKFKCWKINLFSNELNQTTYPLPTIGLCHIIRGINHIIIKNINFLAIENKNINNINYMQCTKNMKVNSPTTSPRRPFLKRTSKPFIYKLN